MNISLSDVANVLGGTLIGVDAGASSISTDTRTIESGALFFALKGESFNGEVFVERAFDAGACAAVVSRHQPDLPQSQIIVEDTTLAFGRLANYKREMLKAKVVAITGSCGKTSVKGMLASILSMVGLTHATHANFNNHIGVPLTIFSCSDDADYLVIEAGTGGPGEIEYLTQIIDPDLAVVVNVHPAHIQYFGSLDAIAKEKSEIFTAGKRLSKMVVNVGMLSTINYSEIIAERDVVFFSEGDMPNDGDGNICVTAKNIELNLHGHAVFILNVSGTELDVELGVNGIHQVENALAAAACAHALNVDVHTISKGLMAYGGAQGRMQLQPLFKGYLIDDSYNANPASMKAAIDYLSQQKNTILVLGDMGELGAESERAHQEVGEYAAGQGIERLLCVGAFADDYTDGFGAHARKCITHDEVLAVLLEEITDDTYVLVKGSRFTKMDRICRSLISMGGSN